jgi:hypothetical protein
MFMVGSGEEYLLGAHIHLTWRTATRGWTWLPSAHIAPSLLATNSTFYLSDAVVISNSAEIISFQTLINVPSIHPRL